VRVFKGDLIGSSEWKESKRENEFSVEVGLLHFTSTTQNYL